MTRWENPYAGLQYSMRHALADALRRTNGTITREAFLACVESDRARKAEPMLLRLCSERPDGTWEWKPEITSKSLLVKKLGGSAAVRRDQIEELWARSHELSARTAYPSLAVAGHRSQHVSGRSLVEAPVFGVDILVRPPTTFSEDRGDPRPSNDLVLGEEAIALVVHGTFEAGHLVSDGTYLARLVVGDGFPHYVIADQLRETAGRCELAMQDLLHAGDAAGAVAATLPHLQSFSLDAARAFLA